MFFWCRCLSFFFKQQTAYERRISDWRSDVCSADLMLAQDIVSSLQRIAPGRGYGFNGAVIHDPAVAGALVGPGTYQWDGAAGCWFWIDSENDLYFVGMIQRVLQEGFPRFQEMTQRHVAHWLTAQGVVEAEKIRGGGGGEERKSREE